MKLKYLIAFIISMSVQAGAVGNLPSRWPFMVSAGGFHACALDAEGVKCWGNNEFGQTNVPSLKSPIQVSAGWDFTCALDVEGVKCWGNSRFGETKVPALKSPTQVTVGTSHICALDAEGVKCWGDNSQGQIKVPALNSPIQISAGAWHTCALDTEGVKCWGNPSFRLTEVPLLKSPNQVSAGSSHSCALDAEGVKCWGRYSEGGIRLRDLKEPIQVSAGMNHTCALDAEGVKCWGDPRFNEACNVPNLIFDILKWAVLGVTSARAEYLKAITYDKSNTISESYYFALLLTSPAILSMDSKYIIETYSPRFKRVVEINRKSLGYSDDIREVSDTETHRQLAIVSIQSALSVSLSFISQDQQTLLQESLRAAGVAIAGPMNNQKIKDLVLKIDSLSVEKQKLKSSPKSAFLVDSLELATNWLREKAK